MDPESHGERTENGGVRLHCSPPFVVDSHCFSVPSPPLSVGPFRPFMPSVLRFPAPRNRSVSFSSTSGHESVRSTRESPTPWAPRHYAEGALLLGPVTKLVPTT